MPCLMQRVAEFVSGWARLALFQPGSYGILVAAACGSHLSASERWTRS